MAPSAIATICSPRTAYVGVEPLPIRRPPEGAKAGRSRPMTSLTSSAIDAPRARSTAVKGASRRICTSTSATDISIVSCSLSTAPGGIASASKRWAMTSGKEAGWARMVRAACT